MNPLSEQTRESWTEYRDPPCPGGGRDSLSPADPAVAAGDGHLHHETRPGPRHGSAISGYKGWAVTIRGSQPRNHAHWNRRYVQSFPMISLIMPGEQLPCISIGRIRTAEHAQSQARYVRFWQPKAARDPDFSMTQRRRGPGQTPNASSVLPARYFL